MKSKIKVKIISKFDEEDVDLIEDALEVAQDIKPFDSNGIKLLNQFKILNATIKQFQDKIDEINDKTNQ